MEVETPTKARRGKTVYIESHLIDDRSGEPWTWRLDRTERQARKAHACTGCRWRRTYGPTRFLGLAYPDIQPGDIYVESYELGDDPYHPGRYHPVCFDETIDGAQQDEARVAATCVALGVLA